MKSKTMRTLALNAIFILSVTGLAEYALAQSSLDLRGGVDGPGGAAILGFDNRNCDAATAGAIRYNSAANCAEFCDETNWICPTTITSGCKAVGDTCSDGSIFAGLSPDGQTKMYTTPADAPSTYTWNDGTTNYTDMSMTNCTDTSPGTAATCQTGEANTALLVGLSGSGSPAPYNAAEYCDGLSAHGYSDWYLPAQDELNVLYTNKNTGALNGTFNETGSFPTGYYWSSSEEDSLSARDQRFSDGNQSNFVKDFGHAVRCVRR